MSSDGRLGSPLEPAHNFFSFDVSYGFPLLLSLPLSIPLPARATVACSWPAPPPWFYSSPGCAPSSSFPAVLMGNRAHLLSRPTIPAVPYGFPFLAACRATVAHYYPALPSRLTLLWYSLPSSPSLRFRWAMGLPVRAGPQFPLSPTALRPFFFPRFSSPSCLPGAGGLSVAGPPPTDYALDTPFHPFLLGDRAHLSSRPHFPHCPLRLSPLFHSPLFCSPSCLPG